MDYNLKIMSIEQENPETKKLIAAKPRDFKFKPGQALLVSINKPGLKDDKRLIAATSLNSDYYLELLFPELKYDRFTENLCKTKAGEEITIFDAAGTLEYKGKGIFIALESGILRFIAMFRQLKQDENLEGNSLVYCAKTKDELILERELKHLFGKNCLIILTREQRSGYETKRIDELFLKEKISDYNQEFYICGPKDFVNEINQCLSNLGAKKINSEFIE